MDNRPALEQFVRRIASFIKDQECETHDKTCEGDKDDCVLFDMESDDAVETLHLIITEARILRDAESGQGRWADASPAFQDERPWSGWTVAFAAGSDWDTTAFALKGLLHLNVLLTTADGRSRAAEITDWQVTTDDGPTVPRQAGIRAVELDTKDYERLVNVEPEFIRYEDIREIVVY